MKFGVAPRRDEEYTAFLRAMGKNVAYHRRIQGLTQIQAARKANICVACLSKIEKNSGAVPYSPSLATLYDVARALGVKLTDILPRDTDIEVFR